MIINTVQVGSDPEIGGIYIVINGDVDNKLIIGSPERTLELGTKLRSVAGAASRGRLTMTTLQACICDWREKITKSQQKRS